MGEGYIEQLVKQQTTMATKLKRAALIALVVVGVFLCMLFMAAFPVLIGIIALVSWLWKRTDLEFEYLYFSGDLDIDKIMGMQKRKRVFSTNVKSIVLLAPTGAYELQQYQNLKAYDCSSNSGNKTYEMIITQKGEKVRVIFEPNEKILNNMRMYDPRKILVK